MTGSKDKTKKKKGKKPDLEKTISKAQNVDRKLSDLTGTRSPDPAQALPPAGSYLLPEGDENEEPMVVKNPKGSSPGILTGIGPKNKLPGEDRIIEKNLQYIEKELQKHESSLESDDDDLVEDASDFDRPKKHEKPKEKKPDPKPITASFDKPKEKPKDKPKVRERPIPAKDLANRPFIKIDVPKEEPSQKSTPNRHAREEPRTTSDGENIAEGKYAPAVAGVATTSLSKCPNCGGFVNRATSSSCYNCGYSFD